MLAASTKFLRIMDMASVELGGYELRFDPESVYATDNFFPLLGLQGVDISALSPEDFRGLLHRFEATCPPTGLARRLQALLRRTAGRLTALHPHRNDIRGRRAGSALPRM